MNNDGQDPDDGEHNAVLSSEFNNYNTVTVENQKMELIEETQSLKKQEIEERGYYTVDDAMEYIGLGRFHYFWLFVFGVSSFSQATELTVNSLILTSLGCEWNLTLLQECLIPAMVLTAAIPGDYFGGWLSDIHGRKIIAIVGQFMIAIFGVISAFMPDYYSFIAVRCIVGFGFGMLNMVIIVQIVEICPTAERSKAVCVAFVMWAIGNCYIIIGAYFLLNKYDGWRMLLLWAAIPCIIMCFIIPFMDESMKYLIISGRGEEAKSILYKIAECNKIEMVSGDLVAVTETQRGQVADMLSDKYRLQSIALCFAMFMANLLYIGNVFDTPYLFDEGYCVTGYISSDDDNSCAFSLTDLIFDLVVTGAEFLSIPIFAIGSEYLGRKRALQTLSFLLAMVVIACLFCINLVVILVELFLTRAFSNAALLLLFVYTPESYPTYMRSIGFGVAMLFCNAGGVCAIFLVYMVGEAYSWTVMFYTFVAAAIFLVISTCFLQQETLGTRLRDNRED